jgi:biotin carboxylase
MTKPLTFLCVSSYFKGEAFIRACKEAGNTVYLLTSASLRDKPWPWEHIDDTFYVEEDSEQKWNMEHVINGIAWKMRHIAFDRFVALDDFDVEKVALLREQFRIPGMGDTTGRYFRDKLAMRMKAREEGIPVPAFTPLFNDEAIHAYTATVPAPWMIKPRSEASAVGIKKIHDTETLWKVLNELGDNRHRYLMEQFRPGTVYHGDALTYEGKVVFARISRYLDTPFEVAHGGGIFRSHTCDFNDPVAKKLKTLNAKVLKAFGMQYSASHTEFIECKATGELLFLETSSRVGGAHLAEMVEYASGVNLWAEWARLETAVAKGLPYQIPTDRMDHAGIVVSLSRNEHPDASSFNDPEIVWRLQKPWHIGMVVKHKTTGRVLELLHNYCERIQRDFHAAAPAPPRAV